MDDELTLESLNLQSTQIRDKANTLSKALLKLRNARNVMIVSKLFDPQVVELTKQLTCHIIDQVSKRSQCSGELLDVFLDTKLRMMPSFDYEGLVSRFTHYKSRIHFWDSEQLGERRTTKEDLDCVNGHRIDFIITLGGDGTVLYSSWLFQKTLVPPILPFHVGSLGFLANFATEDIKNVLEDVVGCHADGVRVNMRMRFSCRIHRFPRKAGYLNKSNCIGSNDMICFGVGRSNIAQWSSENSFKSTDELSDECFDILNDLVIDRGPSAFMSMLELFVDDVHLTTVQADGLVVATPTGSTAYSLSTGASVCHPQIPAMLVTPICPHTLSFRPMLLPDNVTLKIQIPFDDEDRSQTCWVSFDGRHRIELNRGDSITVSSSSFYVPTICRTNQSGDWFESLRRCLHWNQRTRQKHSQSNADLFQAKMYGLDSAYTDSLDTNGNSFKLTID